MNPRNGSLTQTKNIYSGQTPQQRSFILSDGNIEWEYFSDEELLPAVPQKRSPNLIHYSYPEGSLRMISCVMNEDLHSELSVHPSASKQYAQRANEDSDGRSVQRVNRTLDV